MKYTTNGNKLVCGSYEYAVCNDENTALILMHALNRDIEASEKENTMLLPAAEWERTTGIEIIDADGWRQRGEMEHDFFYNEITLAEFKARCMDSTLKDPRNVLKN